MFTTLLKINRRYKNILITLLVGLLFVPASLVHAETYSIERQREIVDSYYENRLKGIKMQIPIVLNPQLMDCQRDAKNCSKIDPFDTSRVPIAQPITDYDLWQRGKRYRIALPPVVAEKNDPKNILATLLMVEMVTAQEKSDAELVKLLRQYEAEGSEIEQLLGAMNELVFSKTNPSYDESGYHIHKMRNSSCEDEDYRLFFRRLKRNIHDGYVMPCEIDRSKLYKGGKGNSIVILTGYFEHPNGGISYVYFVDPDASVQDKLWDGLKIAPLEFVLKAILSSPSQSYIW